MYSTVGACTVHVYAFDTCTCTCVVARLVTCTGYTGLHGDVQVHVLVRATYVLVHVTSTCTCYIYMIVFVLATITCTCTYFIVYAHINQCTRALACCSQVELGAGVRACALVRSSSSAAAAADGQQQRAATRRRRRARDVTSGRHRHRRRRLSADSSRSAAPAAVTSAAAAASFAGAVTYSIIFYRKRNVKLASKVLHNIYVYLCVYFMQDF